MVDRVAWQGNERNGQRRHTLQTGAVPVDLPVGAYSVARIGVDGRRRSLVVGLQVSTLLSGDENKLILVYRAEDGRGGGRGGVKAGGAGKRKEAVMGESESEKEKQRNVTV